MGGCRLTLSRAAGYIGGEVQCCVDVVEVVIVVVVEVVVVVVVVVVHIAPVVSFSPAQT